MIFLTIWYLSYKIINVKLTAESSLQLRTKKLSAYAELTSSEFNKISEILPIFTK